MKKIGVWVVFVLVGSFLTISWAQASDPVVSVAEILPAETFFLAGVPRPAEILKNLSASNLGQIWSEIEVQEWIQSILEKSIAEPFSDIGESFQHLKEIPSWLDQGIYFAEIWETENQNKAKIQKLLIFQSSQSEKLQRFVTLMEDRLLFRVGNSSYKTILKRRNQNEIYWTELLLPRNFYFYGTYENTLVFGQKRDLVLSTLERLKNRASSKTSALSQDPSFLDASKAIPKEGKEIFWAYLDLEKMALSAPNPPQWSFLSLLLGLEKIKALVTIFRINSNQFEDQTVLRFKDSTHWSALLKSDPENSWASSAICPANTVFFASFKVRPSSLIQGFREQRNEEQVEQSLNQFKQQIQFSLLEDFLGFLGEEVSVFISLPHYGFLPHAGIMVPVSQPEPFFKLIEKLFANQSSYSLNSLDYLNHRIYYLTQEYDFFPRWNPAFTYLQNHFVISYNVISLKALLKRKQSEEESLMASESWKNALQKRSQPHQALCYINTKQIFTVCYEIFSQLVSVLPIQELPFHPLLLPDTETIAQHLDTSTTFIDYRSDSIQTASVGDGFFPSVFALGYLGLLECDIFFELYEQVSKLEQEISRQLEGHCYLLISPASETEPAQWIKSLSTVFQEKRLRPWISPFDPEATSETVEYCSYEYFPEQIESSFPVSNRWDSSSLKYYVLYDKKPFYNGGRFVLLSNRTVEFVPEEEFQRELQKQIQEFKK
ncbi:MAG: DUF3352 domain-containing protein [Planctomycetota bacterium]